MLIKFKDSGSNETLDWDARFVCFMSFVFDFLLSGCSKWSKRIDTTKLRDEKGVRTDD